MRRLSGGGVHAQDPRPLKARSWFDAARGGVPAFAGFPWSQRLSCYDNLRPLGIPRTPARHPRASRSPPDMVPPLQARGRTLDSHTHDGVAGRDVEGEAAAGVPAKVAVGIRLDEEVRVNAVAVRASGRPGRFPSRSGCSPRPRTPGRAVRGRLERFRAARAGGRARPSDGNAFDSVAGDLPSWRAGRRAGWRRGGRGRRGTGRVRWRRHGRGDR